MDSVPMGENLQLKRSDIGEMKGKYVKTKTNQLKSRYNKENRLTNRGDNG